MMCPPLLIISGYATEDRTMMDKLAGPDFAGQDNDGQTIAGPDIAGGQTSKTCILSELSQ